MTQLSGAAHFSLAEDILALLRQEKGTVNESPLSHQRLELQRAQVHATLALTAATLVAVEMDDWDKP